MTIFGIIKKITMQNDELDLSALVKSGANNTDLAHILIARLERISVDSHWAWRASGMRRSLLRCLAELEDSQSNPEAVPLMADLINHGFIIVESAAREMRNYKE